MFNFGKKSEDDPKKALDNADKALNSGLSGALAKGFMGKDFVDKMNQGLDMGKGAVAGMEQSQMLAQTGLDAIAEVVSIQNMGMMINNNPVVMLTLKAQPSVGPAFETTGQSVVSLVAIPRVGDKIKIKYNPADPSQILVV